MKNFYSDKKNEYFESTRPEIQNFLPIKIKRLLDVGCGGGMVSWTAKQRLGIEYIAGIEVFEEAAKKAGERLDKVLVGDLESIDLDFPEGYFDCILCADSLEHMTDPWKALNKLTRYLDKEGRMVVSLPNIQNIIPLSKIIFNRLEYSDDGILDRTHLKFFTLHTMQKMFSDAGLIIEKQESNISFNHAFVRKITFGLLDNFAVSIYYFILKKK
jgi:2-polyprenyl-3-methyl-5-hydroxy-6-metoxy-1,4-benzoquinol methylase